MHIQKLLFKLNSHLKKAATDLIAHANFILIVLFLPLQPRQYYNDSYFCNCCGSYLAGTGIFNVAIMVSINQL